MSENGQAESNTQESKKVGYWESLNRQFETMQGTINTELAKMQETLAVRSKEMSAKLDDLGKINDMFHTNLDKQLTFQSRLDKIIEESNKRQIEQQIKFQEMIDKMANKKREQNVAPKKDTEDYSIKID